MQINYYRTDENYNNKGLLISMGIHAGLLLAFFFMIAWTVPNPPPGGSDDGIAVNFGVDDFGMGENNEQPSVQNEQPVKEEQQEELAKPVEEQQAEVVTTEEETPYKVEEKKEKKVKETKKVTEPVKEPKETKTTTETKTNSAAKTTTDSRNTMGNGDKDKAGDQGKETGTLNSKNFYGNGNSGNGGDGLGGNGKGGNGTGDGNGDGVGLSMAGWRWTSAPKVKDNSSESGKIVFKITVDEDGTILSAIPVENQLSPSVTKIYKEAVMNLTLEKTSLSKAAENSVGYVTFIIRTK